jgi:hypothetical protein
VRVEGCRRGSYGRMGSFGTWESLGMVPGRKELIRHEPRCGGSFSVALCAVSVRIAAQLLLELPLSLPLPLPPEPHLPPKRPSTSILVPLQPKGAWDTRSQHHRSSTARAGFQMLLQHSITATDDCSW